MSIACVERRISIAIELKESGDVWFGLVFNDRMEGDTLVFTTGKDGGRVGALYYYHIAYPWITGDADKDWTRVSHLEGDGGRRIEYATDIDRTPWESNTSRIRFRYAVGYSLELQKHVFRSQETYELRMDSAQTTRPTLELTREPTSVPAATPTTRFVAMNTTSSDALNESGDVSIFGSNLTALTVVSIFGLIGILLFVGIMCLLRRNGTDKYGQLS